MLHEVIRWDANRLGSRLLLDSWNNYFHFPWLVCSRNCFSDELQPICRYMKSKTHCKNTFFFFNCEKESVTRHSELNCQWVELMPDRQKRHTVFCVELSGTGLCLVPFRKALNSAGLFQISFFLSKYFCWNLILSIAPTRFDRTSENRLYTNKFYLQHSFCWHILVATGLQEMSVII